MKQHYSSDEADAILGRALEHQPMPGDMTRDQFVKLAGEVGVTPEQLETAEAEYRRTQETDDFWTAYRAYRRGRALALVPVAIFVFFILLPLLAARSGPGISLSALFPLVFIAAIGIKLRSLTGGGCYLPSRRVRRFAEYRRRMGLPVPPEFRNRDW